MVQMKRRWAFKKINIHVNVTCHGTLDVPISDYRVSDSGHVIENLETHQCFVMFQIIGVYQPVKQRETGFGWPYLWVYHDSGHDNDPDKNDVIEGMHIIYSLGSR